MTRRLSTLDLLPEIGQGDLAWAYDALQDRRLTQQDILEELNRRLGQHDIPVITKSAFNRWAVKTLTGGLKRPERQGSRQTEMALQPATLRMMASAFRMMADDFEEAASR